MNDKNSWNSAKTALFLDLNFLFQKKYSESRFWIPVLATKTAVFFCIWIFYFRKIKWKSVLAAKKAVFWEEIRKLLAKIIFLWTIKPRKILQKQQFFLNLNFLFLKIQWKLVLATVFGYENSSFFCIWIFYFRKNKMKVIFGSENSSFSGSKYGKNLWPKPRVHLAMCCTYFPCLIFQANAPQGKFFGEIAAKIAQKSNTKNKIFGGKWCKNRTFWNKNIF